MFMCGNDISVCVMFIYYLIIRPLPAHISSVNGKIDESHNSTKIIIGLLGYLYSLGSRLYLQVFVKHEDALSISSDYGK